MKFPCFGKESQARVSSTPEALFQKIAWALEAAADAGDHQGYHYLTLILRTSSSTLKTRMLANKTQAPRVVELERLKSIWDQLAQLHEASDNSNNTKSRQIAEDIYFRVMFAPTESRPAMVWLVTQYVKWLSELDSTILYSPITYHTLGHLQRLASKHFKRDNVMEYQVMGSLALCYRLFKKTGPAARIEDFLIQRLTEEAVEQARVPTEKGWTRGATVYLERLFN